MEPIVNVDGDSELSFEALTFGDTHNNNHSPDHSDDSPRSKSNKLKNSSRKTSPTLDDMGSAAIYISSVGEGKIDVQHLLKRLENFGIVKAYYFKEKQDFGFVQFLDPSIVDVVVDTLNRNGFEGQPLSVERANGKSNNSMLSFGGTAFSPYTPGLLSPSSSVPSTPTQHAAISPPAPEKPDTILVLKNLPFSLKQDQLQEILMQMNTTAPQSINLHFDNAGVFKGMAFIKYRGIEDAIKVFEALNGYDVGGRKVRVEYKRKNKGTNSGDIPQEWCDDEDLKKLWDQIKDFSNNQNMSEISFANTLSLNHRKHVLAMAEKLKLAAHQSNGESSSICIRRAAPTPTMTSVSMASHQSSGNGMNGNHSHENGRGININKPRSRTNSDSARLLLAGSPRDSMVGSFSDKSDFRSPRTGSSFKQSGPSFDQNSDWRNGSIPSPASTPTQGGILIAPIRQPKGPDGSKGFSDVYRNSRNFIKKPIAV